MPSRAAEVGLEDGQAVGVLLRAGVGLPEATDERSEVVLRVQVMVVRHLPDDRIIAVDADASDRPGDGGEEEDGEQREEERRGSHRRRNRRRKRTVED